MPEDGCGSPAEPAPGGAPISDGAYRERRWLGRLNLRFARRGDGTVLAERRHEGPLVMQRPFFPEGREVCHGVLLHPPGGLVQGDRLELDVSLEAGAHALLTTPGATRFYRSEGEAAALVQRLRVAEGALLEWLPQETIVFEGARAETETRVELYGGARFFGWELLCLGRPAAGEAFRLGSVLQRIELWREGRPLFWERGRWEGGSRALGAPWGLAGKPVLATAFAAGAEPLDAADFRAALAGTAADALAALSAPGGVLVGRYLGATAEGARRWLAALWAAVRPALADRAACPPRIWLA
jgi:urease accessory protein